MSVVVWDKMGWRSLFQGLRRILTLECLSDAFACTLKKKLRQWLRETKELLLLSNEDKVEEEKRMRKKTKSLGDSLGKKWPLTSNERIETRTREESQVKKKEKNRMDLMRRSRHMIRREEEERKEWNGREGHLMRNNIQGSKYNLENN